MKEASKKYFADFNLYTYMAHFVAEILHLRPSEILDTWGVPELLVAYGQYANEMADEQYESWKAIHLPGNEQKTPPRRYVVRFIGVRELEEDGG